MNSIKLVCIAGTLFLLSFPGWTGTFIETFNEGDLGEWQELVQQDNEPGSWEVLDRKLHAVSTDGWLRLRTIGDKKWQNYTIEVDVKPLEKHGRASIVIAARIKDPWLIFCEVGDRFVPGWDTVCLTGDFNTNQYQLLHTGAHSLLKLDDWSTLKLSVEGETFTFSVNDEKIAETGDNFAFVHGGQNFGAKVGKLKGLLTGGTGFGLANYTAKFDNIIITGKEYP